MLPVDSAVRFARVYISHIQFRADYLSLLQEQLDISAERGSSGLFNLLIDAGARPTIQTLIEARTSENCALVSRILDRKVEIRSKKCWRKCKSHKILMEIFYGTQATSQGHARVPTLSYNSCPECFHDIVVFAAVTGNLGILRIILDHSKPRHKHEVFITTSYFETRNHRPYLCKALQIAIAARHEECAFLLLRNGAFAAENEHAQNTLYEAITNNNPDIVQALLNADPSVKISEGCLAAAIKLGNPNLIKRLVQLQSQKFRNSGPPAASCMVCDALQRRHSTVANLLIEAGVPFSSTRFCIAINHDDTEMAYKLLHYGGQTDAGTLQYAYYRNKVIFRILIDQYRQYYPQAWTACSSWYICAAMDEGNVDPVNQLLRSCPHYAGLRNALRHAVQLEVDVNMQMLELVLDHGINPNDPVITTLSRGEETAVLLAVATGNLDKVSLLIDYGARVALPATNGIRRTPIQRAAEEGFKHIVEYLIAEGADPNDPTAERGGGTALQLAAIGGFCGIAELLIDVGADVNAPTSIVNGMSALEGAAAFGRIEMARLLLEHGARLEKFPDQERPWAIDLAWNEGHPALARFLEAWLAKHASIEPPSEKGTVVCETCDKTFSNKFARARHMKTHSDVTRYPCPESTCSKTFARKDIMERHKGVHTGEGYMTCDNCGESSRPDYFKREHLDKDGRCKKPTHNAVSMEVDQ